MSNFRVLHLKVLVFMKKFTKNLHVFGNIYFLYLAQNLPKS